MTDQLTDLEAQIAKLRRENDMLRSFVSTSRDALWCIEFVEPVDLTAPEAEIVRQVFENECYWRLCNNAMARLYKLPEDQDFNEQNVRFVFPRNPENEDFVRSLIANDFNMDGAPSLDQTYEGEWISAENDVRARIENGEMHRMWGAVRNLTRQRKLEKQLAERLDSLVNVLSAVPDPVIVVDGNGRLTAANPALEWVFGWAIDDVLGRPLADFIEHPNGSFDPASAPSSGERAWVIQISVATATGRTRACEAYVSAFETPGSGQQVVMTIRGYGLSQTAAAGS